VKNGSSATTLTPNGSGRAPRSSTPRSQSTRSHLCLLHHE
jgi:hypothetical protein